MVGQEPLGLVYPRADISMIPLSLTDALVDALDKHPVIKVAAADVNQRISNTNNQKVKLTKSDILY